MHTYSSDNRSLIGNNVRAVRAGRQRRTTTLRNSTLGYTPLEGTLRRILRDW